ncbi:SCO family protein [Wenzhouxiangella sediminis]|nr:SCO family protein [Wenzhouxiangella sediminis]
MTSLEHARALDEPRPVAAFRLADQHGQVFEDTQLRGTWSVLFVGFTHCPDICPATLSLLASAQKRAGIAPDRLRTIFVSVDPERDTPGHLAEYMGHFNPEWKALTGEKAVIDRLLGSLEMAYVRVPMGNGEYTMDHSTALALIDPEGRMRGYFAAPLNAAELAEDLGKIARAGR